MPKIKPNQLDVIASVLKYLGYISAIFMTGWGINTALLKVREAIVLDTKQALVQSVRPVQDSIAVILGNIVIINKELQLSKKRDTTIVNSFNRYRISKAQSDKEIIEILKEFQSQVPIFMMIPEKKKYLPAACAQNSPILQY